MQFKDWDAGPVARGDLRAAAVGNGANPYDVKACLDVLAPPDDAVKVKAIETLVASVAVDPEAVTDRILNACGDPAKKVRQAAMDAVLRLPPTMKAAAIIPKALTVLGGSADEDDRAMGLTVLAGLCVLAPVEATGILAGQDPTVIEPLLQAWLTAERRADLSEQERAVRADLAIPSEGVWGDLHARWTAKDLPTEIDAKTEHAPSTVLVVRNFPANAEEAEVEMRFRRYGDCAVKKEKDDVGEYWRVNFQFTKLAYEAKTKMSGKKIRGSQIDVKFGPAVAGHHERQYVKQEQRERQFDRVVAARAALEAGPKRAKTEWAIPDEPTSLWSEKMSFQDMLEDYLTRGEGKDDLVLRYLVVGNCPDERELRYTVPQHLQRDLLFVDSVECFGRDVFYMAFRSCAAATDAYRSLAEREEWNVSFAPPRHASQRLWISNINGLQEYDLETVLIRFGLTQLELRPLNKCAYADFSSIERAVEARNHMFGVVTPTGHRLNLDFCDTERTMRKRTRADDPPPVQVVRERTDYDRRETHDRREKRRRVVKPVKEEANERVRCTLFKLDEQCCHCIAQQVEGTDSLRIPADVRIDQRTKREHCKTHMERSRHVAFWHLRAETRSDCDGFDELCDYLVDKDRVGIAKTTNGYVYIVPPVAEFLFAFGLRDTKNLVAIQVEGAR